jgi:hypothetical protein
MPQDEPSHCHRDKEKDMITQEVITAEVNYRLERARATALVNEARKARPRRLSALRGWLTRSGRPPVRHTTPALP